MPRKARIDAPGGSGTSLNNSIFSTKGGLGFSNRCHKNETCYVYEKIQVGYEARKLGSKEAGWSRSGNLAL